MSFYESSDPTAVSGWDRERALEVELSETTESTVSPHLPEHLVDAYIWDREAKENLLGRPMTQEEEETFFRSWMTPGWGSDAA